MNFRLFKNLYSGEKLILFILVSLYLALELINIKLPGLYADEAFPACGSLQMFKNIVPPIGVSFRIFNINFPLILGGWPYETALESYILLPFLWLFGVNVITLRLMPIVMGAFMLLFLYLFLREFFDKKVALLSVFLLVINSIFLIETKLGLNSASILHLAGIAALWSLFRWYREEEDKYFYLGIFLLSLGISIRVWFLWFVDGMVLLAIIFNTELRKMMKGNIYKYIIVSFLILLFGNCLFVFYNLISKLGTFRYIIEHFSKTHCLVNNLEYFHNLNMRLHNFMFWLNGHHSLMEQGSWHNWTPLEKISANYLFSYIFLVSFIWLIFSILFNRTSFPKKRVLFILILFLTIFLQSPFTLSSLGGPHLFILYPLIQIILAITLVDIARNFRRIKIMLTIFICIFLIFIFLECNTTFKNNYLYFKNTGGTGNNSDAIYFVSQYLEDNRIFNPIVMDWGIYHNLIFLSKGKIIPKTFNYIEGGHDKDRFIRECQTNLDKSTHYIFHSLEFTNRPEIYSIFDKIVKKIGETLHEEKIFYQRDGKPIYIVYSVR